MEAWAIALIVSGYYLGCRISYYMGWRASYEEWRELQELQECITEAYRKLGGEWEDDE